MVRVLKTPPISYHWSESPSPFNNRINTYSESLNWTIFVFVNSNITEYLFSSLNRQDFLDDFVLNILMKMRNEKYGYQNIIYTNQKETLKVYLFLKSYPKQNKFFLHSIFKPQNQFSNTELIQNVIWKEYMYLHH